MKTRIKEIEQQLFNKAAIHLLKQNKKSVEAYPEGGGSCMYRGSDSTMCAVGALIPDDMYCFEMEGRNPRALLMTFPNIIPELSSILDYEYRMDFGRFLTVLQLVHDNHEPKYWEMRLRALASDYKLSFDEVEKFLEAK